MRSNIFTLCFNYLRNLVPLFYALLSMLRKLRYCYKGRQPQYRWSVVHRLVREYLAVKIMSMAMYCQGFVRVYVQLIFWVQFPCCIMI